VLTKIACAVFNFLIGVILYKPLELCYNVAFEPVSSLSAININISALNDYSKVQILIEEVEDFVLNINQNFNKINEKYIGNLIISFIESYQNIKFSNPNEYSSYLLKYHVFHTSEYNDETLIKELEKINYDKVKNFISKIFDGASLTSLIYGNLEIKNTSNLFQKFSKLFFNPSPHLPSLRDISDIIIPHPNPQEKSHSIGYFYKVGKFVPKDYAQIILLNKILGEKFFDILRTKNQLGYIVRFSYTNFRDFYYISEKIQSAKPVDLVKQQINEFNSNIKKYIEESPFEKYVDTLNKSLDEPDYSLMEKINRYRPEIAIRTYLFNRNELIKEQLNKLTKKDILKFAETIISEKNKKVVIINGN
jgi:secreted Zn-dependent insulinase-like peptidase